MLYSNSINNRISFTNLRYAGIYDIKKNPSPIFAGNKTNTFVYLLDNACVYTLGKK